MRALLSVAVVISASLLGCTQDSAASNAERDTHMGNVRAAPPPPGEAGSPEAAPAAQPTVVAAPATASATAPAAPAADASAATFPSPPASETPPKKKKP
jgi:hypothetical protein